MTPAFKNDEFVQLEIDLPLNDVRTGSDEKISRLVECHSERLISVETSQCSAVCIKNKYRAGVGDKQTALRVDCEGMWCVRPAREAIKELSFR